MIDTDYRGTTDQPDLELAAWFYPGEIEELRKPWVREPHFVPIVVVYGIAFLIGITGNVLVICVLCCGRTRQCVTFPCLLSMAWADVLFLAVCVPYEIVRFFLSHWGLSTFLCKLSGFIEMVSATATILNLILISIERYFVIAHPLTSKSLCTSRNTKIALVATWVAALLLSGPSFFVMGTESNIYYNNSSSVTIVLCGDVAVPDSGRLSYGIWQLFLLFVLPALILVFCYVRVIWILWMSTRQLQTMTSPYRSFNQWRSNGRDQSSCNNHNSPDISRLQRNKSLQPGEEALQARRQVIKMLMVIITVFLLCWGPKLIVHVMKKLQVEALYHSAVFNLIVIFNCLPYIQSCLNPIIYVLMSKAIRKRIGTVPSNLRRMCLCRWMYRTSGSPVNELMLTNHSATGQTAVKTSLDTYRSYGANEATDV